MGMKWNVLLKQLNALTVVATMSVVMVLCGVCMGEQSGSPDLIITSISYTPPTPSTSDVITFDIVVKNQGTAGSVPCSLLFIIVNEGGDVTLPVPALAPNATTTVQDNRKLTAFGKYMATGIVDINSDVQELDESNNSRSINVYVSKKNKPDLVVDMLDHEPTNPTTIDTITIYAKVKNVGPDPATTSTLAIKVGDESTPMTYTVPPLGPAAEYTVEREVLLSTPGSYIIEVTADYDDDVNESNEENNTKSDTIDIVEPMLPDLVVDVLEHAPANPRTIDTITITAVVKNIGHIPADASTLEIKIGDEAIPATYPIPELDVDSTFTVQREIVLSVPGTYEVMATADVNNDVIEWFETNNTKTDSIEVNYPQQPDLIVETLEHSPALVTTIRIVTIKSVVKNAGYVDATTSTLSLNVDNGSGLTTYTVPTLPPGATFEVERQETFPIAGTYHVMAIADVNDDAAEFYEDNNTKEDIIECIESGPDLVVSTLNHSPANPTTFDLITITAVVENAGEQIASTSTLSLQVGDETPVTYEVPPLAPTETFNIEREISLPTPGIYQVTAIADADSNVAEMFEDNNTAQDSIETALPIIPDIAIINMEYEPNLPLINQATTITVELANIGLAEATSTTLWLLVGDELTPASYEIPPMDVGTSITIQREIIFTVAGTYIITATADVFDVILELDEANNIDSIEIPVFESLFKTIKDYLLGKITLTPIEKIVLDVNQDGYLDAGDMILLLL